MTEKSTLEDLSQAPPLNSISSLSSRTSLYSVIDLIILPVKSRWTDWYIVLASEVQKFN